MLYFRNYDSQQLNRNEPNSANNQPISVMEEEMNLDDCLIIDIFIDQDGLYSHKLILCNYEMTVPFNGKPTVEEILLSYQQFVSALPYYIDITDICGIYFYVCNELTYFEDYLDDIHEYISNINRFVAKSRENDYLY